MYERREIFAQAPLELVAAEVRYPYAPRLRQPDVQDRLQIALEAYVPIRREVQDLKFQLSPSGATQQSETYFNLFDVASTKSVRITPQAILVETTRYSEFPEFLNLVKKVTSVVAEEKAVPAIERLGLRYLDEIRVPESIQDASQWSDWVDPSLVSVTKLGTGAVNTLQGVLQYNTGPQTQLQFTYAALTGQGVVGGGPLKRRSNSEPGPFFLLDFDSFWQAVEPESVKAFDPEGIAQTFESLHAPMGEVFQRAITDRLRNLFRGAA
ncbi:TIGR04255 family protein [Streptomyces sp. NPDC057838]|uniref:TIGR04255 family protein n=1 Tax=unclassified Streptomyces TaxID=2593676 RepID=UPI00368E0E30